MMKLILSYLLSVIFMILSLIHFYWALGGRWGFKNSLPTDHTGKSKLNPTKFMCVLVGIGLLAFGLYYLFNTTYLDDVTPRWASNIIGWLIPTIFIFRALGDFKYVGFFKKIKMTDFARIDSILFSPLCLGIGLIGLILKLC